MKVLWGLIFSLARCLSLFWCYYLETRIRKKLSVLKVSLKLRFHKAPGKNTTSIYLQSTHRATGITRSWQFHKMPWHHSSKQLLCLLTVRLSPSQQRLATDDKISLKLCSPVQSPSKHATNLMNVVAISQNNYLWQNSPVSIALKKNNTAWCTNYQVFLVTECLGTHSWDR